MYAFTSNSYRKISSPPDAAPGETVAEEVPAAVLTELARIDVRRKREEWLRECDWTQGGDSPLTGPERVAWATFRQALRNISQQPTFPDVVWPTPPTLNLPIVRPSA